ncbi:MAG: hypothetical protein LBG48_04695 [Rickettsiales bacterium]|nr:hypothetical protein [Rickettsiales bacterium]
MVFRITLLCLGLFSVIAELEFLNERSEFRNSSLMRQIIPLLLFANYNIP